jgi:hypothetical protein
MSCESHTTNCMVVCCHRGHVHENGCLIAVVLFLLATMMVLGLRDSRDVGVWGNPAATLQQSHTRDTTSPWSGMRMIGEVAGRRTKTYANPNGSPQHRADSSREDHVIPPKSTKPRPVGLLPSLSHARHLAAVRMVHLSKILDDAAQNITQVQALHWCVVPWSLLSLFVC